jgi:hypothetical protein
MGIGSKITTTWPAALRDAEVENVASADAEVAQTLAGRARWLYEHATGGPAVSTEPIAVPKNPQGLWGHDHSGPPYGSCFRHLLFGWGGDADTAGWTDPPNPFELAAWSTGIPSLSLQRRVWVRPFAPVEGAPYSKGYVYVRWQAVTTTSSFVVTLQSNGGPRKTQSGSVTTTKTNTTLSNVLDLRPGFNDILIEFTVVSPAAIYLLGLSVCQIVKRSH